MSLVDLLRGAESIDLTGKNIHQITKGACNPLPYHALDNITDVDQLFDRHQAVMLLYEAKEGFGHWVTLIRHSNKLIEFFDPYGLKIDEELAFAPYNIRLHGGKMVPHLTHLLEQSGYKVVSNTTRLQKELKDVNTCGRHCAVRVLMRDKPLDEYIKLYTKTKHYDPDIWVTALTVTYSM